MRTLFQVLLLSCLPLTAVSLPVLDDTGWNTFSKSIALDAPERPFAASETPIALGTGASYPPLLAELNGLFYLNLYENPQFRARAHTFGPLPLFSLEQMDQLEDCRVERRADGWSIGDGLHLLAVRIHCPGLPAHGAQSHVLLDTSSDAEPLLAIGHAEADRRLQLQPLQPIPERRRLAWQSSLWVLGKREPLEWDSVTVLPDPPLAEELVRELRRWQLGPARSPGRLRNLRFLQKLFESRDISKIGLEQADVARLLYSVAIWLSRDDVSADHALAYRLLTEVRQREPQWLSPLISLADLTWQRYEKAQQFEENLARPLALEQYRLYCASRLARGQSVPTHVLQRLQLSQASPTDCRSHYPLLDAVRAADLHAVRTLLEDGIPGEVVGRDGNSALMLALESLQLEIAQMLVAHGARLKGQYRDPLPLAVHAWYMDRQRNRGQWPRLEFLGHNRAALDEPLLNGKTLLTLMARDRSVPQEAFSVVLKYSKAIERPDREGLTALQAAVEGGNFPAVDALLAAGADPNLEYTSGCFRLNAIQGLASGLWLLNPGDTARQQASRHTFIQLLQHDSKLTSGEKNCGELKLKGQDLLLHSLIGARRADLIRLLPTYRKLRAPSPTILRIAHKAVGDARSDTERDGAREVVNALLELGNR